MFDLSILNCANVTTFIIEKAARTDARAAFIHKKQKPHTSAILSSHNVQSFMVGTAELESATSCMSSKRSNQLSYAPVKRRITVL